MSTKHPLCWPPCHSDESLEEKYLFLLHSIACVLDQLAKRNKSISQPPSPFAGAQPPPISILDYCLRLHKYTKCSPAAFVSALIYIDRAILRSSTVVINEFTIHRLLFAALVCACKFWDDVFFTNEYYAKVGGLRATELSALELNFLFALEFELHINPVEWQQYFEQLTIHVVENQCLTHAALVLENLNLGDIPSVETTAAVSDPTPTVTEWKADSENVEDKVTPIAEASANLSENPTLLGGEWEDTTHSESGYAHGLKTDSSRSTGCINGESPRPSSPSETLDWDSEEHDSSSSNAETGDWEYLRSAPTRKRELEKWDKSEYRVDVDMAECACVSPPYKKMSPTAMDSDLPLGMCSSVDTELWNSKWKANLPFLQVTVPSIKVFVP